MSEELISDYDIRGTKEDGLTIECAWNVGKALADWLPANGSIVVVSHLAQEKMAHAVTEGLRLQGRDVVDGAQGDKNTVISYIKTAHLAGGAVIGFNESDGVVTIELYKDDATIISSENGLKEIRALVEAGNFVPAAVRGELTQLA